MNMAEEYGEPQLEKVAVRFKHSEIANEFKTKLEECVTVVKARKSKTAPEVTDSSAQLLEPAVTIEEVTIEYSEGDDGDYEREYSEGEDNEPMFEKRATLHIRDQGNKWTKAGQGELRIYFDNINLACVNFRIDGGKLITIMISTESNVQSRILRKKRLYSKNTPGDLHPRQSCGEAFQTFDILFVITLYMPEVILHTEKLRLLAGKEIHTHNT
ncbi:hypothetical protein J6590_052062 [Homalodisca vitripennis]|nr:hypothetical protein J6590_052062 [Homalodisca vitripennis]